MIIRICILIGFILFFSCSNPSITADTIYYGGDIITMEGDSAKYTEAIAVKDGKILFVGSKAEAEKHQGDSTMLRDLKGKTLLPGFIDGHSHLFLGMLIINMADLTSPPVGSIESIDDIIKSLQDQKRKLNLSDTDWIMGSGYDPDLLKEKRHPTAEDFDKAFPTNPVFIWHVSGHMGVINSAALKLKGINTLTPDPEGGTIVRKQGSKEPSGLLLETALMYITDVVLSSGTMEETEQRLERVFHYYASNGITTAQEGRAMLPHIDIAEYIARQGKLPFDFVILPDISNYYTLVSRNIQWGKYKNRLKYGGIKFTLDGSPQGKTAFLSKPYLTMVPGCTHDCSGLPTVNQEYVNESFLKFYKNNIQLFSHCNGDASIDMMFKGHQYAIRTLGDSTKDRRTTIIHSQIMRPDQVDLYKKFGLFPSFFTNHTFFWGDVHIQNLGEERASFISPTKSCLDKGIIFNNHTDYNVTPMNQLFTVWTAVNRVTRSGNVLGPEQRISPYEALKAITINSAYMYFEEDSKGSLKEGKLADLVILNQNPLKVEPMKIRDIFVLETIKENKTIFAK